MQDPQIWTNALAENINAVVYKDGVFYAGSFGKSPADLEKQVNEGALPREIFGKKVEEAPFDEITRVVANNVGDLTIECDGKKAIKLTMQKAGVAILETIQDAKGRRWVADVQRKARVWSALISMLIGLVMGGGMVWIYFGVISGDVNRIQWLIAILINTFGPAVLLVIGALIFIGGMFGFGYYLVNPAEVWTLEEE